jgi:hypothetical protein
MADKFKRIGLSHGGDRGDNRMTREERNHND